MRQIIYLAIFLLIFIFSNSHAAMLPADFNRNSIIMPNDSAAEDSSDSDDDLNRLFAIGAEYASDQASKGLHNNIKIPYIEPNFTYTAPKGFYTELSAQCVLPERKVIPEKDAGFDDYCLNPGWDIDLTENTDWNIDYTHYFFSPNTANLVKSSLSNDLETYVSQWIGNLKGKFTVDYTIYKGKNSPNDFTFTPDLLYKLKWKLSEKTALKVKPEASIDIGTRNYYTQYLVAEENDSTKKGLKPKNKNISSTENSSFGALDYNLVLTVDLAVGKWDFEPAFNYTDPLYKPSNVPNPPLGYFTFSVAYTISTK
ncbi:MAG: hypothetical protein ACLQQ4_18650 [Bacteroidia bacterium]